MNLNLHKYYDTIKFGYVNDIFYKVSNNIVIAAERDNLESFNELLNFLIYKLKGFSFNKSLDAFSKSVTSFVYIFSNLPSSYKKILIDRVFESLISNISLSYDYKDTDIKYTELSYLSLINIFKIILEDDDYELFNYAIKKFDSTIFKLENKDDRENLFFSFITTLLGWMYFLKSVKKITYEKYNISYLESNLEDLSFDYDFNFINNFFELFDNIENRGLWAVSDWEYNETPMNQAYIALSPHNWMAYSLVILLLRFDHFIKVNDDLSKIKLNPKFKFIYDDIKNILDKITIDNDNYKDVILNKLQIQDQDEELNFKKGKILNVFLFLKKEIEIDYYKKIKEIPLSNDKIESFRSNVGKLWEENTLIINLLKELGNIEYVPNVEEVKGYGFFQRLLKMKFAFIDGDLYQNIIGLSDFGSKLARNIDNNFFDKLNMDRIVTTENVKETVLKFINNTENKNNIVIFADWKNAEKLDKLTYDHTSKNKLSNKWFEGVPVVYQYSKFKDSIVVIDFSLIKATIFTNDHPNWYKKHLLVEVTESQKEDITEDIIKEWNENDGFDYNKDEIDILESNNVNVKILLKYEISIPEESRYIIIK